jgi:hypothetical protein
MEGRIEAFLASGPVLRLPQTSGTTVGKACLRLYDRGAQVDSRSTNRVLYSKFVFFSTC